MTLRSLLSSGFKWLLLCLLALAALAGATYWLPELIERQPARVEALLSERLGHPVRLEDLSVQWQGSGLALTAGNVQVLTPDGPALQAEAAQATLWPLQTLWQRRPVLRGLAVRDLQARVARTPDGGVFVQGLPDLRLSADDIAALPEAARLTLDRLLGPEGAWTLEGVTAGYERRGSRWRATATVALPAHLAQQVHVVARGRALDERLLGGRGRVHLRLDRADLTAARPWLPMGLSGRASGELWGWWRSGELQSLRGAVQVEDPGLTDPAPAGLDAPQRLDGSFLSGRFHWRRTDIGGWTTQVEQLVTDLGGAAWALQRLALGQTPSLRGAYWDLAAEALDLATLERLAQPFAARLPPDWRSLATLNPEGQVDALRLRLWQPSGPGSLRVESVRAEVRNIGWTGGPAGWPRIGGLTGTLWALPEMGVFQPAGHDLRIDWPERFLPLSLGAVHGLLSWQRLPQGWHVTGRHVSVDNPAFAARLRGDVWLPPGGGKPWVALRARLDRGDVAAVRAFVPERGMPEKARDWLRESLVAGRVTDGVATLRGWLGRFPFEQGDGIFQARLQVQDGVLSYHSEWPTIRNIDADVRFQGAGLVVNAQQARVFDYDVGRAWVRIGQLRHPVVEVRGQGDGSVPDLLRFLRESPLAERYGGLLKDVTGDGGSRLGLALTFDVKAKQASVNGAAMLMAASLRHQTLGLTLEGLQGRLGFSERGLATQALSGTMLGGPVTLAVARPEQEGGPIVVTAEGQATAPALANWLGRPLPWLAGEAPWRGRLAVTREEETTVDLTVHSDLSRLEIDLPAPIGKPAGAIRPLEVRLAMTGLTPGTVAIDYGEVLRLSMARAADRGWRIEGDLTQLPTRDWLPVLTDGFGTDGGGGMPAVRSVVLNVAEVAVGPHSFSKTRMHAERLPGAWRVRARNARGELTVRIPERISDATPLAARLSTLEFTALGGLAGAGGTGLPGPAALPPLSIRVDRLTYGKRWLGELNLQLRPDDRGIRLQSLRLDGDVVHLEGDGLWERRAGGGETRWRWMLASSDFGTLLDRLGIAAVIDGGDALLESNLHWPGSPADFAMGQLDGELQVRITDGRLVEVEPGVGRVFGLLSLQALPRRLALDFRDVFQEGLAFNLLKGQFRLENGKATTDDVRLDGPAVEIRIRGETDLARRHYNQWVTVTPKTGTGVPIVGALAANPAVGLALWMVGELLDDPVGQAMRREYRVTGPWQAPEVRQISEDQRRREQS